MIEVVKSAWTFEAVLRDAGIHLERGKAPCPFHEDKNPSFSVKGEHGRCWAGCFNGDVIDFTAKYHGLDFKGALRLLADRAGIKPASSRAERIAAENSRKERKRKQSLVAAFRLWEQETVNDIAEVLRAYRQMRATRTAFTEAELVTLAELQGEIDILEARYEVFCRKDDGPKLKIFKQEKGLCQ